jgi:DNA-binding NtrC family response regulator
MQKPDAGPEIALAVYRTGEPAQTWPVGEEHRLPIGRVGDGNVELLFTLKKTAEAALAASVVAQLLGAEFSTQKAPESVGTGSIAQRFWTSGDTVFASRSMLHLLSSARRIAATDANVLVTGESGSGKDIVARAVHGASARAGHAFVAFNCSTVPKDLIDSQLFGHRKGAFTGAGEAFEGLILSANGGTLFLDEVADLPLDVQPKLLRFLDSREVHAIGATRPVIADVRVIAATNADVEALVAEGRLRRDLYYRLNTFRLEIPPLRERREDVEAILDHLLAKYQKSLGRTVSLSLDARALLLLYPWPGNVRQLSNEAYRIVAGAEDGHTVGVESLSREIRDFQFTRDEPEPAEDEAATLLDYSLPLKDLMAQVERAAIANAVATADGNQALAARRLGLSRKGLYLARQRLGLGG